MIDHCYLFSCIEVDRVKVHVVGGSAESQTRGRVEELSGKACAVIVTVDPPGSRKLSLSHGLEAETIKKTQKKVPTKFWRRIGCPSREARCRRRSRTLLGFQSCNRPERRCSWSPPSCPRIWYKLDLTLNLQSPFKTDTHGSGLFFHSFANS